MEFDQSMEYNISNISFEKSYTKCGGEASPRHWIPSPGVLGSKPLGGSKVDLAFHSFEINQMSSRMSRGLSGTNKDS